VGFDYVSFRLRVLWMEYGEKAHTHYAFLVMELKLTRTNSIFFLFKKTVAWCASLTPNLVWNPIREPRNAS
jgi:hypothetical protein